MLLQIVTRLAFKTALGERVPAANNKAHHGVGGNPGIRHLVALCLSDTPRLCQAGFQTVSPQAAARRQRIVFIDQRIAN